VNTAASPSSTDTITSTGEAQGLPPGSVLAQRYRIEGLLGIGGMGMVYRATDLSLGVEVALKLLRPELSSRSEAFDRFRQEVLLARQISSPHVLRIHDIARDGEHWFISMDHVDGESLDRLLDREGALPVERALRITAQVAAGLAAAHAQQVVHRDLKPSNVLIDAQGNAVIADFGIARSLGGSGLTHTGAIVGTPDYLSPEQARGGAIDARSDLYTLGLLLYEMLSGQLPYASCTAAESLSQRMSGALAPIERRRRDLPTWVARLVARLLKPNPAHRLQTAEDVIAAISTRRVARDWRPLRRPIAASIIVLALVAAAIWAWPMLRVAPPPPPPERVLVLPIEYAGQELPDAALAALAEQLRQGLSSAGGPAVVDGERTAQALTRLGLDESDAVGEELLLHDLPASVTLALQLQRDDRGYRMNARLRRGADAPVVFETPPQASEIDAAQILLLDLRRHHDAAPVVLGTGMLPDTRAALVRYGEGLSRRRLGQVEAALIEFEAATALEPQYAAGWLAMAQSARQGGDPARLRAAIAQGRELPSPMLAAEFSLLQSLQSGDWAAAERRLRERLEQAPDDFWAQLQLADVYGEQARFQDAEDMLSALLARDSGEARGWFLRGKYSILSGRAQPAVDDHLMRAVLLFKRYRDRFGEAEAVNALGVGYARLGQMADAGEQYRKALELREAIGHRRGVASSLRNLAQLATIRGQLDEAGELLDRARALFEAVNDPAGLAAVDNELGLLAEERGDYASALQAFRLALRGREALSDRRGSAESLNNIGFAHYQLGDYDSARVFWQQARDAFTELADLNGQTRTVQNLGLLEMIRGRWVEARRLLEQSLATAEQQQMAEEQAVSRRNLAELALLEGRLGDALTHLQRSRALFVEREDQRGLIDVELLRGQILLAAGADDESDVLSTALQPMLEHASTEQRALGALLRAELAPDERGRRLALVDARRHADAASSKALLLRVELAAGGADDALGERIQVLGHRGLWLQWVEQALAVPDRPAERAAELYRSALAMLPEGGRYLHGWRLHRLGARALQASGQTADAAVAEDAAAEALQQLRQATPAELAGPLEDEIERWSAHVD